MAAEDVELPEWAWRVQEAMLNCIAFVILTLRSIGLFEGLFRLAPRGVAHGRESKPPLFAIFAIFTLEVVVGILVRLEKKLPHCTPNG